MMGEAVLHVDGLPAAPLDAAQAFFAEYLPRAREAFQDDAEVVLVFPGAGHEHRAWRLAAVQELAREAAPKRVNAVTGDDRAAVEQAIAYLADAPGITGQLLVVDGKIAEVD
jgi:hypothetical protein